MGPGGSPALLLGGEEEGGGAHPLLPGGGWGRRYRERAAYARPGHARPPFCWEGEAGGPLALGAAPLRAVPT